jgi:hypothetical protein
MGQMVRLVTAADDGALVGHRALICDRDRNGAAQCDNNSAMLAFA